MIVLTSNGLSSENLLNELKRVLPHSAHAAIVTTASVGYKEKDWHIPRLTAELQQLCESVTCVDIEFENPKDLLTFDVVEIIGGNPFYLLKQIRKQNAEAVFSEIAEQKFLIGISAGSAILQNNINLIAQFSPELNDDVQLTSLNGLGLTDLEILPHYQRFQSRFERFEERAKQYEVENRCSVIRLIDGEGIFVDGKDWYKV
ncbi:Type 1 glutamine amidotransferase-like domain-containing protein [bacterium]|nr:Type 1 glutamine amidotransferase-like domain-containing protein [bacterium]